MTILHVVASMNPQFGGVCQAVKTIIMGTAKYALESEVVCLDSPQSDFFKEDGIFKIHALGAGKTWAYHPALAAWLVEHLAEYDAAIIHGLWLYTDYAAMKAFLQLRSKGIKAKIFVMPHGMLDPWFQRDKSRKLKALRNEIYWRLIERKVVNSADGLLFTCEQELLLARETFKGYRPKKELNIGYGIQAPPVYTDDMRPALNKPYLLFLSRIHSKKGVDLLIAAYLQLEASGKDIPDLVIAGPKDGPYAQTMTEQANQSKRIHFAGMLQGKDKWGAFYGCEAFILPSHQENFGIAVVEAMACGKPVLISNQVNIWREIAAGKGGLVAPDTLEGTYELLSNFTEMSKTRRKEMGASAMRVYQQEFTIAQAAENMKTAIKEGTND